MSRVRAFHSSILSIDHHGFPSQCIPNTTSKLEPKTYREFPEGPRWRVNSVEVCLPILAPLARAQRPRPIVVPTH